VEVTRDQSILGALKSPHKTIGLLPRMDEIAALISSKVVALEFGER